MQDAGNGTAGMPFLCTEDGTATEVSEGFTNLTGFSESEIKGKSLMEITRMLKMGSQVKIEYIEGVQDCYIFTKELEPLRVNIACSRKQHNQKIYSFIEIRGFRYEDKLPYINTGEGIEEQESLLLKTQYDLINGIIENLDLGCTRITYPEFEVNYLNNKTYEDLKIINPDIGKITDVYGKCIFDIFKYSEQEIALVKNNLKAVIDRAEGHYSLDRSFATAVKEKFLKVNFEPIIGIGRHVREIAVIAVDITEEIKAKNKMEQALKAQDEILANVSHELKTPLNVIFTAVQLMEFYMKSGSFEENRQNILKAIDSIKQNCYRFTKLINNIVDISKVDSGVLKLHLSNQNIVEVVEGIVQSVAYYTNGKGLSITFDTNTEEKVIACDKDKIERVILNLISNAIKFTNPGGSILVKVQDKGSNVKISVKDTGIGIEEKYLDSIFERYYQVDKSLSRNAEGSGIGLALVKSLVELHGGEITAQSKVNKGSTFTISLPVRVIKEDEVSADRPNSADKKTEMIKVEFSDIYPV